MDTNQTHDNNYQINSFVKGMNSDTAYDQVDSAQYLFGQNIRVTNNVLLFGGSECDITSNNTEQVIAPVLKGIRKDTGETGGVYYTREFGGNKCLCTRWFKVTEFENQPDVTFQYDLIKYNDQYALTTISDSQNADIVVDEVTDENLEAFSNLTKANIEEISSALGSTISRPAGKGLQDSFSVRAVTRSGISEEKQYVLSYINSYLGNNKTASSIGGNYADHALFVINELNPSGLNASNIGTPSQFSDILSQTGYSNDVVGFINAFGLYMTLDVQQNTIRGHIYTHYYADDKYFDVCDSAINPGFPNYLPTKAFVYYPNGQVLYELTDLAGYNSAQDPSFVPVYDIAEVEDYEEHTLTRLCSPILDEYTSVIDDGMPVDSRFRNHPGYKGYPYIMGIASITGNYKMVTYRNLTKASGTSQEIHSQNLTDWGITFNPTVTFEEGEDTTTNSAQIRIYSSDPNDHTFCRKFGENNKICFFIMYHMMGSTPWDLSEAFEPFKRRVQVPSQITPKNNISSILAVSSIENDGAIITKNVDNTWTLYKANYLPDQNICNFDQIYTSSSTTNKDKFSMVLLRETSGILKAYVADGKNPPMCFFLQNDEIEKNVRIDDFYNNAEDILFVTTDSYFPVNRPALKKIAGNLKTQQVQYTYRFYRRYGCASRLCPLTNKIQIISDNRNREEGNAEDSTTNVGIRLTIPVKQKEGGMFNYVQVFRVSYIKYQQEPEITLIYDKSIENLEYSENTATADLVIDDIGVESLAQYSLEEFSALQTQTIVPKCIESAQGYLFQANAEDKTIIENQPSSVVHATPVYFEMNIDNGEPFVQPQAGGIDLSGRLKLAKYFQEWGIETSLPLEKEIGDDLTIGESYYTASDYLEDCGLSIEGEDTSYNNMFVSSMFRSIRIDDKYQYGIVYYDKYGKRSDVKKIPLYTGGNDHTKTGKLIIPENSNQFAYDTNGTTAKIYGAFFKVDKPENSDIVGYEIVRCEKSFNYTKNILQVALSRPLIQGKYIDANKRTPYYPNVYLSSDFYYIYYRKRSDQEEKTLWGTKNWFDRGATNAENFELYQAFSPEINIARNDVLAKTKADAIKLVPYRFVEESENYSTSAARLEQDYTAGHYIYFADISVQDKVNLTEREENSEYWLFGSKLFQFGSIADLYIPIGMCGSNAEPQIGCTSGPTIEYENLPTVVNTDISFYVLNGTDPIRITVKCLGETTHKGDLCMHYEFTSSQSLPTVTVYFKCKKLTSVQAQSLQYTVDSDKYSSSLGGPDKIVHPVASGVYVAFKYYQSNAKENKSSLNAVFKLNNIDATKRSQDWYTAIDVKNVADVKNPNWENGFSDVQYTGSGSNIIVGSAIKQYKSYATSIGGKTYDNWVSNGMYDLATTQTEGAAQPGNVSVDDASDVGVWHVYNKKKGNYPDVRSRGFIGPGPVCLLLNLAKLANDNNIDKYGLYKQNGSTNLGTLVANITHDTIDYSDTNQAYYGFGNFRKFDGDTDYTVVFDGEMYPDFAEFTNMFKTYDFKDRDYTLISGQTVYYIPLSSTINTYFDYGQNYRNTQSANLMLEPGQIEGIASQERPLHQYNMIYSDNDWSINSFFESPEKKPDNEFPQRIYYSQLKTNGEPIDNWQITKPADFIDADSKYGQITNLLAQDNTMYFWQEVAFGKLSVNERSLVTDNNGEQIQLGQGGVLQRTDYLSTKYGMREQDYAAINTEDALFWIDIVNKAVVMCRNNQVVNYGETLNVQNILNKDVDTLLYNRPTIHYDLQNNELLCKCLTDNRQLVFNVKYGHAASVYTRSYKDIIDFNNTLLGIATNNGNFVFIKYNNITNAELGQKSEFLSPTVLSFVVNSSPSQTKVFDNQKVVTMSREWEASQQDALPYYLKSEYTDRQANYFTNKEYKFETSIKQTSSKPEAMTDREGNICYAIPREGAVDFATGYGNRMRGKWLKVTITDKDPKQDYCISHIITKFRQSFS